MIRLAIALAVLCLATDASDAQDAKWPTRPITIFDPHAPSDPLATRVKMIAARLASDLGVPVVVDSRPGETSKAAGRATLSAPPDGHSFIVVGAKETAIDPHLAQSPLDLDGTFEPVSLLETLPVALMVRASFPAGTLNEWIDHARSRPWQVRCGSSEPGGFSHMSCLLIARLTVTQLNHLVYGSQTPYDDLAAWNIDMAVDVLPAGIDRLRAGKLRAIAVTGESRFPSLPDVPTFAEFRAPSFAPRAFLALFAPKGVPPDASARMRAAAHALAQDSIWKDQSQIAGATPASATPAELMALVARERTRWAEVVRGYGLLPR